MINSSRKYKVVAELLDVSEQYSMAKGKQHRQLGKDQVQATRGNANYRARTGIGAAIGGAAGYALGGAKGAKAGAVLGGGAGALQARKIQNARRRLVAGNQPIHADTHTQGDYT